MKDVVLWNPILIFLFIPPLNTLSLLLHYSPQQVPFFSLSALRTLNMHCPHILPVKKASGRAAYNWYLFFGKGWLETITEWVRKGCGQRGAMEVSGGFSPQQHFLRKGEEVLVSLKDGLFTGSWDFTCSTDFSLCALLPLSIPFSSPPTQVSLFSSLALEGGGSRRPSSPLPFSLSFHRVWKLPEASGHNIRSEGNSYVYFYPHWHQI